MMECIIIAFYSIIINGKPNGDIKASKGLIQRDSLSPYLFLMCTEGLHGFIKKVASNGDISGVSLCQNGPKLTRLLFANDSLIFSKAEKDE